MIKCVAELLGGMKIMSYGWFVKLCTFISTRTKCTRELTHGTEVSVSVGWLIRVSLSGLGQGERNGGFKNPLVP